MTGFSGKAGLIQRVIPHYRKSFFDALAKNCESGLHVFAGQPRDNEMIKPVDQLEKAVLSQGKNIHILQGRFYMCLQIGLMKWLKSVDPDVLIVEANPRYLSTPAAVQWMHQRSRPVIGWGLGSPEPSGIFAAVQQNLRRNFLHRFDAIITYSQNGASEYADLGFSNDHIFVAANAVAPPPAHPLPDRPDHDDSKPSRVLFVGRLQARKNLDNLLKACAGLPTHLQPELVIVGDGPEYDRLNDLASQIYPKTHFSGALYGEELNKEFIKADLFVLPGTGGLAIQQAMSWGLPVIAAQADGTQADLIREENGWQIPADDPKALMITLEKALRDKFKLRKMGAESYRIVSEEINLDQMVHVFVNALNWSRS